MCAKLSRWIPRTIVCVATASQRLHIALGYDAARMVVVANGFDLGLLKSTPQQVNELRRVCGFVAEDLVIGTVGRFNAAKDQQNFVRAAGLVVRQFPDIKFVMVGRGCDASNAELAGWLMASGVAGCTVLLGERGDVPVCLAAMDVFCLPSRAEGFPNVVGEAMAMRRPCVVTDVGDAASLVGDCGTVVAKESARSLADGLNKMLSLSGDERDAVGARARARIESNFSMVQTRLQFQAIYDAAMRAENRNQEGKT
jgi:glycosyltransferase involved in cell wall biosynthesis